MDFSDDYTLWRVNFAERLRMLAANRGLSQAKLAALTGVGPSIVSYYMRGESVPTAYVAVNLARALEITTDELLGVS